MNSANPLWGAPRIHGKRLKLGSEVSQATVAKYMVLSVAWQLSATSRRSRSRRFPLEREELGAARTLAMQACQFAALLRVLHKVRRLSASFSSFSRFSELRHDAGSLWTVVGWHSDVRRPEAHWGSGWYLREEEPAPAPTSTIGAPVEHLDLATVIKVSQAVSGEIVMERLIDTLMRTAIEHAGAGEVC